MNHESTNPAADGKHGPVVTPGLAVSPGERHKRLRQLVAEGPAVVVPGVIDAMWARLCERRGFGAVYVTGAGVSNSYLGLADVGLVSFAEMLDRVERIVEAVSVPVIVDMDTGYGGLISISRATALMERAGASGLQIEDQQIPKRCGHFDGQTLVSAEAMQARIDAAVQTRGDDNLQVIARTDACGVEGFESAIRRAERYVEAGADGVFIESPRSVEEIKEIPARINHVPVLFNVVEGGKSPDVSHQELEAMGYRIILHANYLMRYALKAGGDALDRLRAGTPYKDDELLSWNERQELVLLPELDAFEDGLRQKWGTDV